MSHMSTLQITIAERELPENVDDTSESARLFREYVDLRNAISSEQTGGADDFSATYRESLGQAKGQTSERQRRLLAIHEGHVIGIGAVDVSLHELQAPAYADVGVHEGFRSRGVAAALLAEVDRLLREEGRSATQTWVVHPPAPGPTRTAATGWGVVPADTPSVRFLERAGFALEQVERMSSLRLGAESPAMFERMRDTAAEKADGYSVRTWSGRTPDDELESLAQLHARMSTDVPAGALEVEPEQWDAKRLADYEQNALEHMQRQLLHAVAYDAHGAPVAFTLLSLGAGREVAFQEDTLVHADHRGHRLGALVKAANLLQLLEKHPERTRVTTWNAEENRHMLDVNEQLGFEAIGFEGAWQRREAAA